jgi:hypothetical protein
MQNIKTSFLDQVLTSKHIEDLKESSLGIEITRHEQVICGEFELDVKPTTTLGDFIEMYANAKSRMIANDYQELMEKSFATMKSEFENHFKSKIYKVFEPKKN